MKEIRKRLAKTRKSQEVNKITGRRSKAEELARPLVPIRPTLANAQNKSTAVALVGPKVINLPPPKIPPIKAATADPNKP